MMNNSTLPRLLTIAGCLLSAAPLFAAPLVRYEARATVDFVNDPFNVLAGLIQPGDTLTGLFQYDLALPDQDPSVEFGFYDGVPLSDNFISGTRGSGDFFETQLFFDISVENDVVDRVELFASGDTIPSTLAAPGIDFVDLQVILQDDDGTALSSDALPTDFNLADYETAVVYLSAETSGPVPQIVYEVEAIIDSITRTVVPEPQSLALLASAAAIVAGGRRWSVGS